MNMNYCKPFLYIAFFILFAACASDTAVENAPAVTTPTDAKVDLEVVQGKDKIDAVQEFTITSFKKLNCKVEGEVLENNQKWIPERDRLIAIVADKSTEDPDFGESHRLVRVYDSEACEVIFKQELPVNVSPDYPYYLMGVDSMDRRLVGILGTGQFYVYDLDNNLISPALKPQFKGQRYLDDAQSGNILQMETIGRYVVGYSEDIGPFVYNLTIPKSPKQEQPIAEYKVSERDFSSLFLLKAEEGKQYAILPEYNAENRSFALNTLTEEATPMSSQLTKSGKDTRYVVLRTTGTKPTAVAVDMQTKKRIALPAAIATKNTQEVLAWVKQQGK